MEKDYSVTIRECSRELTAKERIKLKDTSDAIKLDNATQVESVTINPDMFAILDIHNERSENKDYTVYIIVDENGQKYITGSESFWNSFSNIYDDMRGETEDWAIKAYRKPSRNREGKDFITCSIV